MIHLMELPNPDPLTGRPEHGGRDRHTCIAIRDVSKLKAVLDKAGISFTLFPVSPADLKMAKDTLDIYSAVCFPFQAFPTALVTLGDQPFSLETQMLMH